MNVFFIHVSFFHEQTTAIHQLNIALSSVSAAGRAFLLYSSPANSTDLKEFSNLVKKFLSVAVVALDANDPPKTCRAMKLICSIFSNVSSKLINSKICSLLLKILCIHCHYLFYLSFSFIFFFFSDTYCWLNGE